MILQEICLQLWHHRLTPYQPPQERAIRME
jgi:hypothetical protein